MDLWVDTCLICGKRFFSKVEIAVHVKNEHASEENIATCNCPFCAFEYTTVAQIESHIREHHHQDLSPIKVKKGEVLKKSCSNAGTTDYLPIAKAVDEEECAAGKSEEVCPVCGKIVFEYKTSLAQHVEEHFSSEGGPNGVDESHVQDELLAIRLQHHENYAKNCKSREMAEELYLQELRKQHGMGEEHNKLGFRGQAFQNMEQKVGRKTMSSFDYYRNKLEMIEKLAEGIDDGSTVSSWILECLKHHFERTLNSRTKVWLCASTDHYGRGPGDSGWGCGYRNVQMLLSCLRNHKDFEEIIRHETNGNVPSIPKIQEIIEKAWSEGYDACGREQLESKLINTRKWIGATEAFTFFATLKLHCRIIDFPRYSGPHKNHLLLQEWIMDYFQNRESESENNVIVSNKPPLYLQHQGHSRTVVGILCELDKTTNHSSGKFTYKPSKVIIFDPGHSKYQLWKVANKKSTGNSKGSHSRDDNTPSLQLLVKPIASLNEPQYQIVCVAGVASSDRVLKQKNVDLLCEKVE